MPQLRYANARPTILPNQARLATGVDEMNYRQQRTAFFLASIAVLPSCENATPVARPIAQPACPVAMRFHDSNSDGLIDVMQIDHTTHHLTAWIDSDHDGFFDRRIYEEEGVEVNSVAVRIRVPARK